MNPSLLDFTRRGPRTAMFVIRDVGQSRPRHVLAVREPMPGVLGFRPAGTLLAICPDAIDG